VTAICDQVAERVALGEPVGDDDHVATCERCQATVAVATSLAAARRDADPGLGFSARMTVGARRQIAKRRNRRYLTTGLAAVVASAALAMVVMMPSSNPDVAPLSLTTPDHAATNTHPDRHDQDPVKQPSLDPDHDPWAPHDVDADVFALVQAADTDRAMSLGADWTRIEAPVAPYRKLAGGK
jgi:hypothetical protein